MSLPLFSHVLNIQVPLHRCHGIQQAAHVLLTHAVQLLVNVMRQEVTLLHFVLRAVCSVLRQKIRKL